MKKRISLVLLALAMCLTLLTPATAEEPVTLTYWQHSSAARDEMMTELVKQFEAANPDIKINVEFIPEGDYTEKLIPSLATASAPDVFQVQSGMVAKLADAGSIQPLDESVMSTESIAEDFVAATVDGLKFDGQYYGMPTDTQTIICLWNKDLVAAAGLDAEAGVAVDEVGDHKDRDHQDHLHGDAEDAGGGEDLDLLVFRHEHPLAVAVDERRALEGELGGQRGHEGLDM